MPGFIYHSSSAILLSQVNVEQKDFRNIKDFTHKKNLTNILQFPLEIIRADLHNIMLISRTRTKQHNTTVHEDFKSFHEIEEPNIVWGACGSTKDQLPMETDSSIYQFNQS